MKPQVLCKKCNGFLDSGDVPTNEIAKDNWCHCPSIEQRAKEMERRGLKVYVGDTFEADNLKWEVTYAEPIYPEREHSPQVVIGRRILKSGKLGKQRYGYDTAKGILFGHRNQR